MSRVTLLFVFYLALCSCNGKKAGLNDNEPDKNAVDHTISFAGGFTLSTNGANKILTVRNPWQHARGVEFNYILSDTLASSRAIDAYSWVVKTPVQKVICLSTTHIGYIDYLNRTGTIRGISGKEYVVHQEIRNSISNNHIADVGYDENLNYEMILKLKPDIVFAYGVSVAITNTVKKLNELGIPVVLIGEYLEQDPLAKMEWVKVFAAFYGLSTQVSNRFDLAVSRYLHLKTMASAVSDKPTVLLGLPWRGNWYISGSKSYVARLVNDAGGSYLWNHLDFNESRPLGLEKIYEKALTADFWLNPGDALSKKDIMSVDERFVNLPPFENDKIYNNNNQLVESGGNAFYESGVVEPDIILKDLICILHPELLPMHNLKYYRKLQ